MFLSTKSGVVVVSSRIKRKSSIPNWDLTLSKTGVACCKNRFQVSWLFCANKSLDAMNEISLFKKIRSLLTLILSSAEDVCCKVFCPKITIPSAGNLAIGLIPASYRSSLSSELSLLETSRTGSPAAPSDSPPLVNPAGANQTY